MKEIYIIVATDLENGIGLNGTMPWSLTGEIKHFAAVTKAAAASKINAVIMGRNTWLSLPEKYRPLPERENYVLTSRQDFEAEGAAVFNSLEAAIDAANANEKIDKIFIIGGGQIYKQAVEQLNLTGIYQTVIEDSFNCDTFFPKLAANKYQQDVLGEHKEKEVSYKFLLLTPKN
jgi:dihydrofolate reductase